MAEYFGSKVEDIFNTMEQRFLPQGAQGVDAIIGYNVSGEGGGFWKLVVKSGAMQLERLEAEPQGCSVTFSADAESFVGVTLGKVDAGEAFSSGRVKVDGDLTILGNVLPKIFVPFTPIVRAKAIMDSMMERFRPDKAEGVDMKFGYNLTGEEGGQWTVTVRDQTCTVSEGLAADCTVTLIMGADIFVGLNTGKIDGAAAFGAGQVSIEGDMAAAGVTAKLFAKFEAAGAEDKGEELISLKCMPTIKQRYATGPHMGKWFKGLKEKKIYASRCPVCGRTQLPPREVCAVCRVRCNEIIEVGPSATVTMIDTVYYASPDPLTGDIRKTPYAALFMVLDGSTPGESFSHEIKPDDIDRIKPGMKVRPVWNEARNGSYKDLLYFEIDD